MMGPSPVPQPAACCPRLRDSGLRRHRSVNNLRSVSRHSGGKYPGYYVIPVRQASKAAGRWLPVRHHRACRALSRSGARWFCSLARPLGGTVASFQPSRVPAWRGRCHAGRARGGEGVCMARSGSAGHCEVARRLLALPRGARRSAQRGMKARSEWRRHSGRGPEEARTGVRASSCARLKEPRFSPVRTITGNE